MVGGLSRETKVTELLGVVGPRSIPGLRPLFSHEVERRQRNHIIITIELDRVRAGEKQKLETACALPSRVK